MKRYKLLKDTPTIKAGTIFEEVVSDFDGAKELARITPIGAKTNPQWTIQDIDNFDEWFEEVNVITGIHNDNDAYLLNHRDEGWTDEMLEPAEKTLYNLEKGDIILFENNDDSARKVLAVVDSCYLLSYPTNLTSASTWYTVDDLKYYRCTVKQSKIETINIDGKEYNKNEVEEAIKDLEAVD